MEGGEGVGLADEIQVCVYSIGNYCAVLSFGNVYHAAQDGSNSSVCEQNPSESESD